MTYTCRDCGKRITEGEFMYSYGVLGRPLCMNVCQIKERSKTYPPRLAEYINENVAHPNSTADRGHDQCTEV